MFFDLNEIQGNFKFEITVIIIHNITAVKIENVNNLKLKYELYT